MVLSDEEKASRAKKSKATKARKAKEAKEAEDKLAKLEADLKTEKAKTRYFLKGWQSREEADK